jgi:exodeoxyribonuclease-5
VTVLSEEQLNAIAYVKANLNCGLLAISGPAGSGKTTLLKELVKQLTDLKIPVTVAAMSNRAAVVLRSKGVEDCVTFHQACLRPLFRPPLDKLAAFLQQIDTKEEVNKCEFPKSLLAEFEKSRLEDALEAYKKSGVYAGMRSLGINDAFKYIERWVASEQKMGVLIVDESSMLGDKELEMAQTVFTKIILVGDEAQLPPVQGKPCFWQIEKRVRLTEVHRQAEHSKPLVLATAIRLGKKFDVEKPVPIDPFMCREGSPVLVWTNKTRIDMTLKVRASLGFAGMGPQVGERLICRNTNDRGWKMKGLFNNTFWTVTACDGYIVSIEDEQGEKHDGVPLHMEETKKGDGLPFRFGYVLTAHTSQGSEFEGVQVHHGDCKSFFNFNRTDARRWLYTSVTRARKKVVWVTNEVSRVS